MGYYNGSGYDFPHTRNYDDDLGFLIRAYEELIKAGLSRDDAIKKLQEDKTDLYGDHKGTWQGFKPSQVDQTLNDRVNTLYERIAVYVDDYIKEAGDDTLGIIEALKHGDVLQFSNKIYKITTSIDVRKTISFIGSGTTLKIDGERFDSMFNFVGNFDVSINGITFDCNQAATPKYLDSDYDKGYNTALFFNGFQGNVSVLKCNFINLYTRYIRFYGCVVNTVIKNNSFTTYVRTQGTIGEFVSYQTVAGIYNEVSFNSFECPESTIVDYGVCGVFLEGVINNHTVISDNHFNYCGRNNTHHHRLLTIDMYNNCKYVTIKNNIMRNNLYGFVRCESTQYINIENNKFMYASGNFLPEAGIWVNSNISLNNHNITINGNDFSANSVSYMYVAISIFSGEYSKIPNDIKIINNTFRGYIKTCVDSGFVYDLKVANNVVDIFDYTKPKNLVQLKGLLAQTEITGDQSISKVDKVMINNNIIDCEGESAVIINLSNYTGFKGKISVDNNIIKIAKRQGDAIKLTECSCLITNNNIDDGGVYMTNCDKIIITGNNINNDDYFLYGDTASLNSMLQNNNFYNGNEYGKGSSDIVVGQAYAGAIHNLGYTPRGFILTSNINVGAIWCDNYADKKGATISFNDTPTIAGKIFFTFF